MRKNDGDFPYGKINGAVPSEIFCQSRVSTSGGWNAGNRDVLPEKKSKVVD